VDNLSLKVLQNEILALLGHNGAGKTTAIGMLTGMLQPTEGEVVINGYSMKTDINQARL
jgi:ABC-type multidrug transport system ATPase subunit